MRIDLEQSTPNARSARREATGERGDCSTIVLALHGELDLASTSALERALLDAQSSHPKRIVIDLGGLAFIDCRGLHALVRSCGHARAGGSEVSLLRGPPAVQRVFELARAAHPFCFDDRGRSGDSRTDAACDTGAPDCQDELHPFAPSPASALTSITNGVAHVIGTRASRPVPDRQRRGRRTSPEIASPAAVSLPGDARRSPDFAASHLHLIARTVPIEAPR